MKFWSKSVMATVAGAFIAGGLAGWTLARPGGNPQADAVPARWVARIDDSYVSEQAFIDEMRRRGGERPGQFQDMEQKRQLLDDIVYRAALVKAAQRNGLTDQPELRRALDQLVSNRYLQDSLRRAQAELTVSDDEVRRYYEQHQNDYSVPARKRVAMLKITLPSQAGESAWNEASTRMQEAAEKAAKLDISVPHFGVLAREVSDDQSTRYRGGVIGWISEGRSDRYAHDRVVLEAVRTLENPGQLSDVLRGEDGIYLVRLVESEPRQSRPFEQLANGIRQRLMQELLAETEADFRRRLMREVGVEVRESALASINPLGPPAGSELPQPPAMPQDQG